MRDSRHLRTFVIGGVVTALIGLVALGGSAGASSPGKAPAKKATGEPIKLQIQGSFTGGGLDFTDIPDAAKAAADAINKAGGVGTEGRPIQIVVCDEGIDPNKGAECARQAVDQKMTAVVGAFTTSEDYVEVLAKGGIPSVADYGISFGELINDHSFPIGATAVGGTAGMGALLADKGKAEKFDVAYLDLPGGAGKLAADFVNYALKPRGISPAVLTPVPTGGADLTPSVQQTIDAKPEGVVLALTDPEYSKWVVAFKQSGGTAKIAAAGSTVNPTNVKALGKSAAGVYVSTNFKPASLTKDPGVKRMLKETKGKGIRLVDASIEAWAGVHLVAQALEGQTTLDAATLLAQLNTDKTWDTLVGPPVNFTKQPPGIAAAGGLLTSITRTFTTSVYYAQVKGGKVKALDSEAHDFLVAP